MGIETAHERAPTPREQLLGLTEAVTKQRMHAGVVEWMNQPKKTSDESRDRMHGSGMIDKLRGFRDQATPALNGAFATLEEALKDRGDAAIDRIRGIHEALTGDPPTFGDPVDREDNPYIRYEGKKPLQRDPEDSDPDTIPQYTVDNKRVVQDIEFLSHIRASLPPQSREYAAMDTYIDYLNAYRLLDPRVAMQEEMYRTEGGRTKMDVAGKEMGRVALTGILAAGTIVFGTIAIVRFIRKGEISLAPLLWAFATLMVSDPKLVKSFFDKDASIKREFDGVRAVTGDATMQELSETYGIGGPGWARAIENVYAGDHGTLHTVQNPTPEAKQRVARDIAAGDARVERELLRMMDTTLENGRNESDFTRFVNKLLLAKTDGTKEFIADYVERDTFREGIRLDPATRETVAKMRALRAQGKAL